MFFKNFSLSFISESKTENEIILRFLLTFDSAVAVWEPGTVGVDQLPLSDAAVWTAVWWQNNVNNKNIYKIPYHTRTHTSAGWAYTYSSIIGTPQPGGYVVSRYETHTRDLAVELIIFLTPVKYIVYPGIWADVQFVTKNMPSLYAYRADVEQNELTLADVIYNGDQQLSTVELPIIHADVTINSVTPVAPAICEPATIGSVNDIDLLFFPRLSLVMRETSTTLIPGVEWIGPGVGVPVQLSFFKGLASFMPDWAGQTTGTTTIAYVDPATGYIPPDAQPYSEPVPSNRGGLHTVRLAHIGQWAGTILPG